MKKRKKGKNRRRKKSYFLNMMLTFWAVFTGMMILGVLLFLLHGRSIGENQAERDSMAESPYDEQEENPFTGDAMEAVSGRVVQPIPEEMPADQETAPEEPAEPEAPRGKYDDILSDPQYMIENNIYAKETAAEKEVSIAFAGDILFDPGYSVMANLLKRANGIYDCISADLIEEMQNADIMMLNNEFPYSGRGMPTEGKQFTFRARPESASILQDMGVDIVSLANNHAYDYGEEAFLDTIDILDGIGMPHVGAGRNLAEAAAPVYFIAGDIKIAILSATQIERLDNPDTKGATDATPGVFRCLQPDRLLAAIRETRENCDFLIVYIHWGTENTAEIDWLQQDQAPKIADAGADLIIGDHSHCLQPVQYVNGVPVVYSLGNFWFNSKELDTCLVKAVIGEDGLRTLQFVPALQKGCATSMLHGEEKVRVINYMRSISPKVTIDEEGFITKK